MYELVLFSNMGVSSTHDAFVQYVYNDGVGFRLFVLLAACVDWLFVSTEDIKLSGIGCRDRRRSADLHLHKEALRHL